MPGSPISGPEAPAFVHTIWPEAPGRRGPHEAVFFVSSSGLFGIRFRVSQCFTNDWATATLTGGLAFWNQRSGRNRKSARVAVQVAKGRPKSILEGGA
jgi:hypothetical protein